MCLLAKAILKLPVFCCSATLMWRRRTSSNCPPLHYYCFYEAKLFLRKLILLFFFSEWTPLHASAHQGHLEVARLLVDSNADVAAWNMCFSPPPSHHLSLTICLAVVAELHSNGPSSPTRPTLLHTCAASARPALPLPQSKQLLFVLPLLFDNYRSAVTVREEEEEEEEEKRCVARGAARGGAS